MLSKVVEEGQEEEKAEKVLEENGLLLEGD